MKNCSGLSFCILAITFLRLYTCLLCDITKPPNYIIWPARLESKCPIFQDTTPLYSFLKPTSQIFTLLDVFVQLVRMLFLYAFTGFNQLVFDVLTGECPCIKLSPMLIHSPKFWKRTPRTHISSWAYGKSSQATASRSVWFLLVFIGQVRWFLCQIREVRSRLFLQTSFCSIAQLVLQDL